MVGLRGVNWWLLCCDALLANSNECKQLIDELPAIHACMTEEGGTEEQAKNCSVDTFTDTVTVRSVYAAVVNIDRAK